MSTWTLPVNLRLLSDEAYTRSGFTFPQVGFVPAQFTIPITNTVVTGAAASITTNAFIVPAGYTLDDAKVVVATNFTGTSVGTTQIAVGTGALATQAALIAGTNIHTGTPIARATLNASGVVTSALAADTTVTYTVSVSGNAAQSATTGSLTAGSAYLVLTVGVPFNPDTRA